MSITIEAFGSTSLVQDGSNYFLEPNGGPAVELSYGGAAVVAGQFGQWTPIGAEQTANGYRVVWKMAGADQYLAWNTDSSGNHVSSALDTVSGTSAALQSFETSFQQDLNGDGSIGGPQTVIEAFGSTSLVESGTSYFIYPTSGPAVELSYGGAAVVAGQFGQWTPIGAEQTANGYQVVWKMAGADQYLAWNTDSSGNHVSSALDTVSGTSAALQSFETSFQQDLNGDGSIGVVPPSSAPPTVTGPTVIEAFGSTGLVQDGSNYFLEPNGGPAVELSYGGAAVVAGQFGQWTPIGAEQTANGYQVVWKMAGADQYLAWNTDSSGNHVSSALDTVSGTSAALQSFETSFQQDLNGDGSIGGAQTVIEAFGSTGLVQDGSNYFLEPNGGPAVELSYGGAAVVAGQFGQWTPIGAEQTANGYQVVWKMAGADQYLAWNTDSSGNHVSSALDTVSGTSAALQSFETSFQQDLNGDGSIGGAQTVIEAFGSTGLVQDGSNYFLEPNGGPAVELSYGGAAVVAGQFGQWTPIGAEQTANGYQVVWKMAGADQYLAWNTDSSGNHVSSALDTVSGTSAALQSFETSFQQDLNGDGSIGGAQTVIEAFGSTGLVQDGSNYFLEPNGGPAVELSYGGAAVVAGQFGQWTPIGAEQTANGYQVVWKMAGADQYLAWNTDSSGNHVSSALDTVSGTSAALQSFETSFQQDLNGDGSIGATASSPHFVYQGVDANGAQLYDVTWDTPGYQPFAVRVLAPDHPATSYDHTFLYTLPVEAGLAQTTWGSGLDELQKLDVANQYNATIIEPIFPIGPWYADSSTDPTINFETFMSTILPTWVDHNFDTSGTDKDLLIGFSKSGYGAIDLLLKHPDVFADAAAWDFPADMGYGDFGTGESYGTEANFQANYQLSGTFIDTWKAPFTTEDRIWMAGSDAFSNQVSDFDTLLTSHGVLHTLAPPTHDNHSWSGGWLSDAVAGLYGLVDGLVLNGSSGGQTLTAGSSKTTLIGGSGDILNGGAGADTFVFKTDFGSNTVNNFTPGADMLEFSQSMFASAAVALGDAQQVGSDVVITHDALDVVTLHNVQLANLHATDFHIV